MSQYISLKGNQFNLLWNGMVDAFTADELSLLLRSKHNERLDRIVSPNKSLDVVVQAVIETAERRGWLDELIVGVLEWNPHPKIYEAAQDIGLTAARKSEQVNLERLVHKHSPYVDIHVWLSKLGRIESQVCRIELPGSGGTGFLVGPNLLLTNYHVVKDVIDGSTAPEQVVLRFDYKAIEDEAGQLVINAGTEYRLAANWCLDHSPYSEADWQSNGASASAGAGAPGAAPAPVPADDELDYALLRVDGTPGDDAPGGSEAIPGAPKRGWVDVTGERAVPASGAPLFIVQHPKGEPLKLAFDEVQDVNGNATRIRYDVNTEPGSSGSPCFDGKLGFVALHHAGDPDYDRLAQYNQGVPAPALMALWKKRGVSDAFPAPRPAAPM